MSLYFWFYCIVFVLYVVSLVIFFFKQKTAYEMRISDWSSDVCSSDLKVRLQCEEVEDKKFLFNVRKANKALEDKGLIVEFFENKACRKTVSISVNVNKHKPFKNQEYKRSEVSDIEMNGEVKGITEEVKEKKTKQIGRAHV